MLIEPRGEYALGIMQCGTTLHAITACCDAAVYGDDSSSILIYRCAAYGCENEVLSPAIREARAVFYPFAQLCRTPAVSLSITSAQTAANWISAWTGLKDVEVQIF